MRAMKDSGTEWIGDIPQSWDVIRIKALSPVCRGASPRPIDNPIYFDENGVYAWVRISDVTASDGYLHDAGSLLSELGTMKSVRLEEDCLFISICASVGKPCITKIRCCIHDGFVYFPTLDKRHNKFLYYLFISGECYEGLGKMGTQLNLNTETIGSIKIPFPPITEQTAVIDCLDEKCGQIESITSKQQTVIEKLKAYKQSVITEAVTKGLDPSVPMKDSGIEWIGEIPQGWDIHKLKYGARCNTLTLGEETDGETEIKYIDISSVSSDGNIASVQEISFRNAPSRARRIALAQDIIISTVRTYLKAIAYITEEHGGHICSTGFAVLTPKLIYYPKYLYYFIRSDIFVQRVESNSVGISYPAITSTALISINTILPPLEEQQHIAAYLDRKCKEIDNTIRQKQKLIERLNDYKKSLIFEAVTGKIEVSS